VLAISFQVGYPWIGAKIQKIIEEQFGRKPTILKIYGRGVAWGTGGTYFLISNKIGLIEQRIAEDDRLKKFDQSMRKYREDILRVQAEPMTDDWPYLYIKSRSIPTLHLVVSGILLAIFFCVYAFLFGKPMKKDIHFASLGAGFLLLEVSIISRFSLFWGTTWIISSIVISLILVAILIANAFFIRYGSQVPYRILYPLIFGSLLAIYFVPLESNLIVCLYIFPFILIGYLFAKSFNAAETASRPLAFNLFGALAGGLSESFSFVFGISSLIFVGIGFYVISMLTLMARER